MCLYLSLGTSQGCLLPHLVSFLEDVQMFSNVVAPCHGFYKMYYLPSMMARMKNEMAMVPNVSNLPMEPLRRKQFTHASG